VFFHVFFKKIAASTMLLHVSIILYIKIYRKWISFSFFIPHFRCICNPLNLLCTFAYFSICTTAKKWLDTMCLWTLELLSNTIWVTIMYSQKLNTRVRNYSQIFKKQEKKNMKKQKKYYPYIIFMLLYREERNITELQNIWETKN